MIVRILLVVLLMIPVKVSANNTGQDNSKGQITTRLGLSYIPAGNIKFTNRDATYDIYDSMAFRVSMEYFVSDLFSIGPSFEYLSRQIEPYAFFEEDIRMYSFYLDFRINHGLTDSGGNYLVFGVGTGGGSLSEAEGESDGGFGLYGVVGLDIALQESIGLELLYRFQTARFIIEERDYRFDGSALQAGLSYRIKI
ncbi:MAG: porin family protein [candidate division Zixibacteria bacterium]|nr:porin family protein [candidate division Zixibacteria bacterium]